MAYLDAQVQSLVGTINTTELDVWLKEGVIEIVNILPPKLLAKCSKYTLMNADANTTLDLDAKGEILKVTREDADSGYYRNCREVDSEIADLLNDSSSLYYATAGSPAYWTEANSSGIATLFVKPTPTNTQPAKAYYIAYTAPDSDGDDSIANFPDEAEYLIPLKAAITALEYKINFEEDVDLYTPLINNLRNEYQQAVLALQTRKLYTPKKDDNES